MNHRRAIVRASALFCALALAATACGGTKKSSATSDTTARAKTLSAVPGFDPSTNTIHLGVITPLTGGVAVIGLPLTNGTETWFKKINDQGGIAGKYKVVLEKQDSQYVPTQGVTGYNAIKDKVVMIGQLLGTGVTKAVLQAGMRTDGMVAAPASLDADWVRDANLLPVGGPYQTQMINAADYVVNNLDGKNKKLCTLTQNDPYGEAGLTGMTFAASKLNVTFTKQQKFTASTPQATHDFTSDVATLKQAGCQVVFLTAVPGDTGALFAKASGASFAPQWVGQSPTWTGSFATGPLAQYFAKNFLLAAEGTEWGDTSVKGMSDMLADVTKYSGTPPQVPNIYFVFGYYQARAVTALLEKAVELGDLSRTGIRTAMTKMGTVSFDGLTGDYKYGPIADREPPRVTTIYKVNAAKPGGLEKVKYNAESQAAKDYKFSG
jgi:ABC-type branched-subunit amino acid transport system substrate-binding protein